RAAWQGTNWLGEVLTRVRETIREQGEAGAGAHASPPPPPSPPGSEGGKRRPRPALVIRMKTSREGGRSSLERPELWEAQGPTSCHWGTGRRRWRPAYPWRR